MALNLWWSDRPAERFWMEITDRSDLGQNLLAPQLDGVGKEQWSYSLVTETRPGDIVLHWHKTRAGQPALVGWSEVTGPLSVGSISWQARGTRGRARGGPTKGPSWIMQCGGFNPFADAITIEVVRAHEPAVRAVWDVLRTEVAGPLYFPFTFYASGGLRAAQAYLTKFPRALVEALPPLAAFLRDSSAQAVPVPAKQSEGAVNVAVGTSRVQDPVLRKAIEDHAVARAVQYYCERGATRVDVVGKPYDLAVHGLGPERHVEVKGSTLEAVAVELTANEVTHARNYPETDLIVVDHIRWHPDGAGGYSTSGGRLRIWSSWQPADEDLSITRYRYDMP